MFRKLSLPLLAVSLVGWLSVREAGATPMAWQTGESEQSAPMGSSSDSGQQTLAGMISNVDTSGQQVTLRLSEEFGRVLAVDSNTVILRDGKPVQMADLHTGESATVLTAGDTALRIDVLSQISSD